MLGAAATQDTVRLVRHGVMKLLDTVGRVDAEAGGRLDDGLEFDYERPNDQPDCGWREKAERERMLTRVAQDAERALQEVEQSEGLLDDEQVDSRESLPSPIRPSTADTVESGIRNVIAISAAVIRSRRNAAIASTRSSPLRCGTDRGADERSSSPASPSAR